MAEVSDGAVKGEGVLELRSQLDTLLALQSRGASGLEAGIRDVRNKMDALVFELRSQLDTLMLLKSRGATGLEAGIREAQSKLDEALAVRSSAAPQPVNEVEVVVVEPGLRGSLSPDATVPVDSHPPGEAEEVWVVNESSPGLVTPAPTVQDTPGTPLRGMSATAGAMLGELDKLLSTTSGTSRSHAALPNAASHPYGHGASPATPLQHYGSGTGIAASFSDGLAAEVEAMLANTTGGLPVGAAADPCMAVHSSPLESMSLQRYQSKMDEVQPASMSQVTEVQPAALAADYYNDSGVAMGDEDDRGQRNPPTSPGNSQGRSKGGLWRKLQAAVTGRRGSTPTPAQVPHIASALSNQPSNLSRRSPVGSIGSREDSAERSPRVSSGVSLARAHSPSSNKLRFSLTRSQRSGAQEESSGSRMSGSAVRSPRLQIPQQAADHSGFVEKKGEGLLKRYKRRWCEIHGSLLYYSAQQKPLGEHVEALGRVCLSGCSVEAFEGDDKIGFEMWGPHLPRTYRMATDTLEDRRAWVDAIRVASEDSPVDTNDRDWMALSAAGGESISGVSSSMSRSTAWLGGERAPTVPFPVDTPERAGWLEKKGDGIMKRYRRRWCELHGRFLFFSAQQHSHEHPVEALGRIDLAGARVETTQSSDGRQHTLQIAGPLLPRTYQLAADTEEERSEWVRLMAKVTQRYESGGGIEELDDWLDGYVPTVKQAKRLDDFLVERVLGRGTFGKVCKVKLKDDPTGKLYAMKIVCKASLPSVKIARMMMEEKAILQSMKHPYIVRLYFAFQTEEKLYLILTYLGGGDLKQHLQNQVRFPEPRVRFYSAEILLALDHLHSLGIVYRDLKPQNVVLDDDGHAVLTDLGLATDVGEREGRTYTFCGTPQYVAPEVLQGDGYARAVDFWSLGIMVYELLVGATPFQGGDSLQEMFVRIMEEPVRFPAMVTKPARDFIGILTERDSSKRVCSLAAAKPAKFLKGVPWVDIRRRKVPPPWAPSEGEAAEAHSKVRNHTVDPGADGAPGSPPKKELRPDIAGEFDGFTYVEKTGLGEVEDI